MIEPQSGRAAALDFSRCFDQDGDIHRLHWFVFFPIEKNECHSGEENAKKSRDRKGIKHVVM